MMALHLYYYPIKQSNVPESAENGEGHKAIAASLKNVGWHTEN